MPVLLTYRGTNREFRSYMAKAMQLDKQISELRDKVTAIVSRSERDPAAYDHMLIALGLEIGRRIEERARGEHGEIS